MVSERMRRWSLAVATTVGGALMLLPWIEWRSSQVMPERFGLETAAPAQLLSVLKWRDLACRNGDVQGFRAVVTRRHFDGLSQKLRSLGRAFDGDALRDYIGGEQGQGLGVLLQQGFAAGAASSDRACVVVAADPRDRRRGALGIVLSTDGVDFLLDHVEHRLSVDPREPAASRLLARQLLGG